MTCGCEPSTSSIWINSVISSSWCVLGNSELIMKEQSTIASTWQDKQTKRDMGYMMRSSNIPRRGCFYVFAPSLRPLPLVCCQTGGGREGSACIDKTYFKCCVCCKIDLNCCSWTCNWEIILGTDVGKGEGGGRGTRGSRETNKTNQPTNKERPWVDQRAVVPCLWVWGCPVRDGDGLDRKLTLL